MSTRKHTRCGGCSQVLKCRQLEFMWRFDGVGPWLWLSAWTCIGCREGTFTGLAQLGLPLIAWDG